MTVILGINAYHGDSAAAVFRDGELLAAAEEERFTRVKHAAGFPAQAIRYCIDAAGVRAEEVDHVAVPRKRSAHMVRKALWALRLPHLARRRAEVYGRFGAVRDALAQCFEMSPSRIDARFHYVEHHVAHAASSYYASPFDNAAVITLDGLGDFASMLWGTGKGIDLDIEDFVLFPHSLGFYYTAITQYLGFPRYGDEYKVMGLASYGQPRYKDEFERIVRPGKDMDFSLDLRYFTHHKQGADVSWDGHELKQDILFSDELERALGPARRLGAPIEPRHQDVAATLQWRLEEIVIALLNQLYERVKTPNLCYAGGVAFNCVANGMIRERTPFEEVYIQPAAGDAGLAVGAAQYVHHQVLGDPRKFQMTHAYWGPEHTPDRIAGTLDRAGVSYVSMERPDLVERAAELIADGRIVGWFQGRTEWGPRALGNRSIVADPRRAEMKEILNRRVKHREPFRPFAPSILEEDTAEWFEKDYPSPFMLMAYPVRAEKRDRIPAPTHVDGTGRLQTVSRDANPIYWELIDAFKKSTGVPVLLNTSFNDNEPMVNTPEEALSCYTRTEMDALAMGPYLVESAST